MAIYKMTPRLSKSFFLVALRHFFKTHPSYPWMEDQTKTKILIQSDMAELQRYKNLDASLVVMNNGVSFDNKTIGNIYEWDQSKVLVEPLTVQYLVEGTMNTFCVCSGRDASEELAFDVSQYLVSIRLWAAKMLQFQYITMPSISPCTVLRREGFDNLYNTPVSVNYGFIIRQHISPTAIPGDLLSEVQVEASTDRQTE